MTTPTQPPYPRPDFYRSNLQWQSLSGAWDFAFDDEDVGISNKWYLSGIPDGDSAPTKRSIQVPFVFQSEASGINEQGVHEVLWYEKTISDIRSEKEKQQDHRLILRFGAVDYLATAWLEGQFVGSHRGGHVPFDLDLTDAVSYLSHRQATAGREYRLNLRIYDSATDTSQPRGKQFWGPVPQSIWYTPSSGIWQNVWLESVPRLRIADSSHGTVLRSHDIQKGELDARIAVLGRRARESCRVELEVSFAGVLVGTSGKRRLPGDEDFVRFAATMRLSEEQIQMLSADLLQSIPPDDDTCWRDGVVLWSPEHPSLYDLTIRLFDRSDELVDEVRTTTGMRSLTWTNQPGQFLLNDKPYFQALLLDQGYWHGTLMTPPTQEALQEDIKLSKSLGFNGCRKHQKVEDPAFLFWADKLGFLVWGEMASCHRFSNDAAERFEEEWMEAVRRDINHPCIVTWTLANESWGYADVAKNVRQRDHLRSLYYRTKALDWTRPINDNCGWEHVVTDLYTFHEYEDAKGMERRCADRTAVFGLDRNGKVMFVPPVRSSNGQYDAGCEPTHGLPILCTELGGVNIAVESDPEQKKNWGYITAGDPQELLRIVEGIVMATVKSGLVSGIVWTQLADVEQEQNGLLTYDRRPKLAVEKVKDIMSRASSVYYDLLPKGSQ